MSLVYSKELYRNVCRYVNERVCERDKRKHVYLKKILKLTKYFVCSYDF